MRGKIKKSIAIVLGLFYLAILPNGANLIHAQSSSAPAGMYSGSVQATPIGDIGQTKLVITENNSSDPDNDHLGEYDLVELDPTRGNNTARFIYRNLGSPSNDTVVLYFDTNTFQPKNTPYQVYDDGFTHTDIYDFNLTNVQDLSGYLQRFYVEHDGAHRYEARIVNPNVEEVDQITLEITGPPGEPPGTYRYESQRQVESDSRRTVEITYRITHNPTQFSPELDGRPIFMKLSYYLDNGDYAGIEVENEETGQTFDVGLINSDEFQVALEAIEDAGNLQTTSDALVTCEASGGVLSWILCPIFNFLNENLSSLFTNFIIPMLQFNALSAEGVSFVSEGGTTQAIEAGEGASNQIRQNWSNFKTIANVLFVITFFVIIFAQSLSLNIDAYTVKKMLPRLVTAVILVQISFFLCQVFSDLMNVLGAGVRGLIIAPIGVGDRTFSLDLSVGGFWASAANGVIQAGAAAGVILFFTIPILSAALLGLLGTLFTVGLRQVVLVFLVLLSPVAMVAWVLPNTQKYSSLWFNTFLRVGIMYPLIVALITIGDFMGGILGAGVDNVNTLDPIATFAVVGQEIVHTISNFSQATDTAASSVFQIIALVAVIAPYFMIPFTFKFAGSTLGFAGKLAGNLGRRGSRIGGAPGRFATKKGLQAAGSGIKRTAAGDTRLANVRGVRGVASVLSGGLTQKQRDKMTSAGTAKAYKDFQEQHLDRDLDAMEMIGMSHDAYERSQAGELRAGGTRAAAARDRIARSNELDKYRTEAGMRAARLASAQAGNTKKEHFNAIAGTTGTRNQKEAELSRLRSAAKSAGKYDQASLQLNEAGDGIVEDTDQGVLRNLIHSSLNGEDIGENTHKGSAVNVASALSANYLSNDRQVKERAVNQIASALLHEKTKPYMRQQLAAFENNADIQAEMERIRNQRYGGGQSNQQTINTAQSETKEQQIQPQAKQASELSDEEAEKKLVEIGLKAINNNGNSPPKGTPTQERVRSRLDN